MVRWIGGNNNVCILFAFPYDFCIDYLNAFAFEINKVDAIVVGCGVIHLVYRRPSEARIFHLVRIDRTPGIFETCFGYRQRGGICHLDGMTI